MFAYFKLVYINYGKDYFSENVLYSLQISTKLHLRAFGCILCDFSQPIDVCTMLVSYKKKKKFNILFQRNKTISNFHLDSSSAVIMVFLHLRAL